MLGCWQGMRTVAGKWDGYRTEVGKLPSTLPNCFPSPIANPFLIPNIYLYFGFLECSVTCNHQIWPVLSVYEYVHFGVPLPHFFFLFFLDLNKIWLQNFVLRFVCIAPKTITQEADGILYVSCSNSDFDENYMTNPIFPADSKYVFFFHFLLPLG